MSNLKEIRSRISSISSTMKITSAMKKTALSIDAVTKTFEEYDINYDDTVSLKDFRAISGNLGFNLKTAEIRTLLNDFENNDMTWPFGVL